MKIVSVDIEKLLDAAKEQKENVLDWDATFNSSVLSSQATITITNLFKPVFGNILNYESALAIHDKSEKLKNVMHHAFRFYDDRMFMILSFNDCDVQTLVLEVDTNKDHYKNLKPYQFNYLKLGINHKYTGILEHNGYLLGYHYNNFDEEVGATTYIVYILFKDNILYTKNMYIWAYNGVHTNESRSNNLDNLPASFNKKEWKEIFESIFILYTIK